MITCAVDHDLLFWVGHIYIDDLENMLDDFMLSLNTELDDGSIEEVLPLSSSQTIIILLAQI